jgi:hypothetical protein
MQYFNIDELKSSNKKEPEHNGSLAEKFINIHTQKIESLRNLTGGLPSEGEAFFLWTVKSFNAFTFIPFIIKQCGCIDVLVLTTYSINTRIIEALIKLMDKGKLKSIKLFVSDSMKFRMPRVTDILDDLADKRENFQVVYAWNHSKIALARCDETFLVFEGSGNFSENAQYEQYLLLNSKKVFEFRLNSIFYEFNR